MVTVSFKNWSEVLATAELPEKERTSYKVIILWYLGHLKRTGQAATVASARAFIEGLKVDRRPSEWSLWSWREGLNWFFRNAPTRRKVAQEPGGTGNKGRERSVGSGTLLRSGTKGDEDEEGDEGKMVGRGGDGRRRYAVTIREMQERVPVNPLLEETIRLMRVRQMAYRTEESYVGWIRRLEGHFLGRRTLDQLGEDELKAFLSHLAVEEGVSASTQRQALNAGVFFLREVRKQELGDFSDFVQANPRKYYPVVYSRDEMRRLLEALQGRWQLMARLQYGCGLRISELCSLRVKDVDLDRGKLTVRAGKGDKDRCVPLPRSMLEDLRAHLAEVRAIHDKDRAEERPGVYLPEALARKMPKAGERWAWFWVFPANGLSHDPRGEAFDPKRRHHVLPGVYQKALWEAARVADIPKRANSHALRHSYATHLLESGVNIRTVQEFLGHAQVETTMIYLHVMEDQSERVLSPLDAVA